MLRRCPRHCYLPIEDQKPGQDLAIQAPFETETFGRITPNKAKAKAMRWSSKESKTTGAGDIGCPEI
jgi:hypothetical protein